MASALRSSESTAAGPVPALPLAPRAAWMWKPRSKLVDGERAASASILVKMRGIGAKQWRRRFLFVDRDSVCYGSEYGAKDKVVPFESIQDAGFKAKEALLKQKAPPHFAEFGWYLHVEGRHLVWCAESKEAASEWVNFVQALLAHMRSLREPMAAPAALTAPAPVLYATEAPAETAPVPFSPDEPRQHVDAQTPQPALARLHESFAVPPAAAPALNIEAEHRAKADNDNGDDDDDDSSSGMDDLLANAPAAFVQDEEGEEDDGDFDTSARHNQFSFSLTDSHASSDGTDLLSASSEDTEGGSDDAGDAVGPHLSAPSASSAAVLPNNSAEQRYAERFLPIAQGTHSHIAFRIPSLAAHLKGGDTPETVVFSRSLDKVGKRDNVQPRELVLTPSFLYLFTRKHVGGSAQVRCIPTDQIVGVAVSTTDPVEMAVLVPSFHDVLLRVTPQNSRIGGTETQVREQLVAHLFKIHRMLATGRRFVYREVPNVRAVVRRSTEDKHQPLSATADDITHAASSPVLFPIFRANADSVVYWSSVVRQIRADRKPALQVLVVTDGAVYVVQDNLCKVVRRASLDTVAALYYDADSQTILLQCNQGSDLLVNVQKDTDFGALLRLIPALAQESFGRHVRTTASKQLYAHARLAPTDPMTSGAVTASATRADGSKPKTGHHTLSRQLRTLWKASMGKDNRYAAHATKASTVAGATAAAADDDDAYSDGDPLHAHRRHGDDSKATASAEQALYAMYRFVEEIVLDYDDELRLLQAVPSSPSAWDTLSLQQRFRAPAPSVGAVLLSAPCRVLDAKETNSLCKSNAVGPSTARAGATHGLCITTLGLLILGKGMELTTAPPTQPHAGSGTLSALGGKASRLLRSATARATAASTPGRGGDPPPASGPENASLSSSTAESALAPLDRYVDQHLVWADIIALVRCRVGQRPLIGIMTARSQSEDLLIEFPSEQCMLDVMTAAAQSYATTRTTNTATVCTFGGSLPLFAAPRPSNVARALKKTPFDPFPTISLRHTASSYSSDALRMAVVPEVADVCRRFGDNTIFFSGVAWRIRSATLRHENGVVTQDPGPRLCRHNNNLYKSYILLLTNCALYHCAKGGFEVMRRTSLLDVEAVYVSTSDPDTIMLTIPSEYDMYFRLEGRGAEFLARLQEAYVEWTNYLWYRPHEPQGTHRPSDYFVPVHRVATVATHGQLTKPLTFNALQANRSPLSVRTKTLRWHERHLEIALAHFERAVEVARTGMTRGTRNKHGGGCGGSESSSTASGPSRRTSLTTGRRGSRGNAGGTSGPRAVSWPEVRELLALAQSFLYFTQRRCFRAGVRGDEYAAMSRAQLYLSQYARLQKVVKKLEDVAVTADMEAYERLLNEATGYPELNVLIGEQSAHYAVFRQKQQAVKAVLALVMQTTNADLMDPEAGGASLTDSLPEIAALMQRAVDCAVDPRTVRVLTLYVDVQAQREQLKQCLASARGPAWLVPVEDAWAQPLRQTLVRVVCAGLWLPAPAIALSHPTLPLVSSDGAGTTDEPQSSLSPPPPPPLVCGVMYLLAQYQSGLAMTALSAVTGPNAEPSAAAGPYTEAALWPVKQCLEAALSPAHKQVDAALTRLSASVAQHQRAQDWTEDEVARLHRECTALARRMPTDHVAADLCLDVLAWHRDGLALRHAALTRHAQFVQREAHARRFYEAETARQAALEARADAVRLEREEAAHQRRRDAFYATWRTRVERLHEDLEQAVHDSHDSNKVRLVGRQCAQLKAELVQGVQGYLVGHEATAAPSSKPAMPAEMAELMAQIAQVSEAARDRLIREAHGGVNPYAAPKPTSAPALSRHSTSMAGTADEYATTLTTTAATAGHKTGPETATTSAEVPLPPLPSEVEAALAACDTEAVVQYVQLHEQDLTEGAIAQLRARWQSHLEQQHWVRGLGRGLEAAWTLRSPTLLRWHLSAAAARGYHDDAVRIATDLQDALQSATTAEARAAVWASHRLARVDAAADSAPSPSHSSRLSRSANTSDADSDIHLDDEEDTEKTETDSSEADTDVTLTDSPTSERRATEEAEEAADVPAPLSVFVQARFPVLDWPPASAVWEETGPAPAPSQRQQAQQQAQQQQQATGASELAPLEVCQALESALRALLLHPSNTLRGAPEEPSCMVECAEDNPHLANLIFCWMQVWVCGLRPEGLVRKSPRFATDVVERVAARRGRDGAVLSPHATHLVGLFLKANRFQTVRGPASDFAFTAYLLQERAMDDVLLETSRLEEKERLKLMDAGAPLRHVSLLGNLLSLAHVCAALVVPYDVRQPAQLHRLLVMAANATTTTTTTATTPVQTPDEPQQGQRQPSVVPPPVKVMDTAPPAAAPVPQQARPPAREAALQTCIASLQKAVQALAQYFTDELAATSARRPVSADEASTEQTHLVALQGLFDEHEHPALIPVLAQAVEPALLALLEAGFQARYQVVRTRSLWDLLERFSQYLRASSRSLVGVEIVGAVELVAALTDEEGRYKSQLAALSEAEHGRVCMRIFLRQCLNRRCLVEAFATLFPSEDEDAEWGGEDGIWAFYDRSLCLLAPRSDPQVDRIYAILRSLSRFPFSTAVDRALW